VSATEVMTHLVIPDTQAKPGAPTAHLRWLGQYIVDEFAGQPLTLIHLGDHADMPSLSTYDKGKKAMENRRYKADIKAANDAFDILNLPLSEYNRTHRTKWEPPRHFLRGNHEDRITRAVEVDAQLEGLLSLDDLNIADWGWTTHDFLQPVEIDGVTYSHYFYNTNNSRPFSGQSMDARIKTVGFTFTQGHQQGLQYGVRSLNNGRTIHGLVAGSFYLHDEDYKGPQGNNHWRGFVVCHQVEKGSYDPMFVSVDYLCRRYEGMRLRSFLARGRTR
jgi:hypothetical protein